MVTNRADGPGSSSRCRQSLLESFGCALRGISYCFATQRNFRIQTAIAFLVIVAGLWLGLPPVEWAVLVVTICAVLVAEMINTGVEALADVLSPDYHPLIMVAKDAAAGAVLLLSSGAVVIGLLLLGPRVFGLLTG